MPIHTTALYTLEFRSGTHPCCFIDTVQNTVHFFYQCPGHGRYHGITQQMLFSI